MYSTTLYVYGIENLAFSTERTNYVVDMPCYNKTFNWKTCLSWAFNRVLDNVFVLRQADKIAVYDYIVFESHPA